MLFPLLIICLVSFPFLLAPKVDATSENKIYLEAPKIIDASKTEIFNVTAWFDGTVSDFFSYQVCLGVDDSIVGIEDAWVPTNNSSWVFYGKRSVGLKPAFYDDDGDGVKETCLLGDCLLESSGIFVSGKKILGIFKLRVVSSPATTWLEIDTADTCVLDSGQKDIPITRQNYQISIVGQLVMKKPSQIIFTISPSVVAVGQEIVIEGRIDPLKPNVIVNIRILWDTVTTFSGSVKTNDEGIFTLTYTFPEAGLHVVEVSWDGDETHAGSKSLAQVMVFEPYARLEIKFAYLEVLSIGDKKANLPTPPVTVDVIVFNASDLHTWKVKVFFDPVYVSVSSVWIPTNSVFGISGLDFNVSGPVFGLEDELMYFEFGAELLSEVGIYGNGTLFRFNITGIRPTPLGSPTTLEFSRKDTFLLNSTGGRIYCTYADLVFQVEGILPVDFAIINPRTNTREFLYYTTEVSLGYKFNATVCVRKAVNLYGWKVKISYNKALLNISRIFDPRNLVEYVFFEALSNFTFNLNRTLGVIEAEGLLVNGEPFHGNGTLMVIEFEIVNIPSEEKVECEISFDPHGTFYFDGEAWLAPNLLNGVYTLKYGAPPRAGVNVTVLGAVVGGAVAILASLGVIKKMRRKELVFEDDLWEIEIDHL